MINQDILGNAPEGATHVDDEGDYWLMHPENSTETFMDGDWLYCNPQEPLRSLSDIQTIIDLRAENAQLEKERFTLLSCLLGISNECIGEIAMNYKLDAQMIGESIYTVTGLSNPELAKALKEQGDE